MVNIVKECLDMIINKISTLARVASLLVVSAASTYAIPPDEDWKSHSVFIGSDEELFKLIAEQEKADAKAKGPARKAIADVGLYTADLTDEEVWALIQAQAPHTNDITDEEWALIRADKDVKNGYKIFQPIEEQKGRPREAKPHDLGLGDFLLKLEENPEQMTADWTKWIARHEERRTPAIIEEAKKTEANAKKKAAAAEAAKKASDEAKADGEKKAAALKKQAEANAAKKAAEVAKKLAEVAPKTLEVVKKAAEAAPAIKKLGPVVPPVVNKKTIEPKKPVNIAPPKQPNIANLAKEVAAKASTLKKPGAINSPVIIKQIPADKGQVKKAVPTTPSIQKPQVVAKKPEGSGTVKLVAPKKQTPEGQPKGTQKLPSNSTVKKG